MKQRLFNLVTMIFFVAGINLVNVAYASEQEDIKEKHNTNSNLLTCFLIKEENRFYVQEGDCYTSHPPCCSFNIALSLMGYDAEILKDEREPIWPYSDEYQSARLILRQDHDPTAWMRNSSFWFSQRLVNELGRERIKQYLGLFNYGNQDLSAYEVSNQGLPSFWLSSSLKISPHGQLGFLENFVNSKLPISEKARDLTKNIIYIEELVPGWKLFGKTGAANMRNLEGIQDENCKYGWFIGFLQKDDRTLFFARYLEAYMPGADYPSAVAREEVKERLKEIIAKM